MRYFEHFVPVLRFSVASDIHVREQNSEHEENSLRKMFEVAYRYGDGSETYQGLDLALVVGDHVNSGKEVEVKRFRRLWDSCIREGTETLITLGNHEFFYLTDEQVYSTYEKIHKAPVNNHIIVNGFHFISIAPQNIDDRLVSVKFGETALNYLKTELKKAAADDPSGKKPIFVLNHMHVKDTVYGSEVGWGSDGLHEILKDYPQVIDFSGHSHYPMQNPLTIWQGEYTAIGTGTLSYYGFQVGGVEKQMNVDLYPQGKNGAWTTANLGESTAAQFQIVEVDASGAVRVIFYDLMADAEIARYYIRTPSDPSSYLYKGDRKTASEAPAFPQNTTLSVDEVGYNTVKLSFPAANVCRDVVESYRVELIREGRQIDVCYLTSGYYFPEMFSLLKASFSDLEQNTAYAVKVYAVNAFGKDCENPLTASFTTKEHTVIPSDTVPAPDVMQVIFDDSGAVNAMTGQRLSSKGRTVTVKSQALNQWVGHFTSGSFNDYGISAHYERMKRSFTLEAYFRLTAFSSSYCSPVSNQEGGGIGFEITAQGLMQIYASINGVYEVAANYHLETGRYYHTVATYDGESLCLYVNGMLMDRISVCGEITWPDDPRARYMAIGGDSGCDENAPQAPMNGDVAIANLYSRALTESEVYRAYLNLN